MWQLRAVTAWRQVYYYYIKQLCRRNRTTPISPILYHLIGPIKIIVN